MFDSKPAYSLTQFAAGVKNNDILAIAINKLLYSLSFIIIGSFIRFHYCRRSRRVSDLRRVRSGRVI